MSLLLLAVTGCSGRESSAAREIKGAGGTAVAGATGVVDYVEFEGAATTDETLAKVASEFTALASLKRIQLRNTAVAGPGLKAFAGLSQVRVVDLQGSPIGDDGLAVIGTLIQLTSLNLSRTKVTDAGLKEIAGLDKLRILDLSGTTIGDGGIETLKKLRELRSLNVKGSRISPMGVGKLVRERPEISVAK